MIKCPEHEMLERLIEGELDDDATNKVLEHLSLCSRCMKDVEDILHKDAEIGTLSKVLQIPESGLYSAGGDNCPSSLLLLAYITHSLSPERQTTIELHLEKCNKCVARLQEIQRYHMEPGEPDLDLTFLDAVTEMPETIFDKILTIVLCVNSGILELVQQTGKLMVPSVVGYSRGERAAPEQNLYTIRKEFVDNNLSLEINVQRDFTGESTSLALSAMTLDNEEFIDGMEFELSGGADESRGVTDKTGIVRFTGIKKARYDIKHKMGTLVSLVIE